MQRTQISLKKGESMITPSVMMTFFEGSRDDGHNKLRSLILKSYTPTDKNGDKITSLPFCVSTWGG
ncbi:MAG: hypothetical protein MJ072_05410, partial [Clostridia bacterium]|nr:hypothetical protein [Clostridia bacterium]